MTKTDYSQLQGETLMCVIQALLSTVLTVEGACLIGTGIVISANVSDARRR